MAIWATLPRRDWMVLKAPWPRYWAVRCSSSFSCSPSNCVDVMSVAPETCCRAMTLRKRAALQVNARIIELDIDDKWAKIDVEMCAHVAGIVINSANEREARVGDEEFGRKKPH